MPQTTAAVLMILLAEPPLNVKVEPDMSTVPDTHEVVPAPSENVPVKVIVPPVLEIVKLPIDPTPLPVMVWPEPSKFMAVVSGMPVFP